MKRLIAVSVGLVLVAAFAIAAVHQHELRGAWTAYRDSSAGHFEIKIIGLPLPYDNEFRAQLRSRYGIASENVGCSPGSTKARWIAGYNWVADRAIRRRFGRDVVADCFAEVRRAWERKRA